MTAIQMRRFKLFIFDVQISYCTMNNAFIYISVLFYFQSPKNPMGNQRSVKITGELHVLFVWCDRWHPRKKLLTFGLVWVCALYNSVNRSLIIRLFIPLFTLQTMKTSAHFFQFEIEWEFTIEKTEAAHRRTEGSAIQLMNFVYSNASFT